MLGSWARFDGRTRRQLLLLAAVQVLVIAVWFSVSAVAPAISREWGLSDGEAALLTAAVQVGFVCGAVASTLLNLADRLPANRLLAACALLAAAANVAFLLGAGGLEEGVALRFITGVSLAGVYPVGLKLMTTWVSDGRGLALGILIAALTLGSSVPHLIASVGDIPWRSALAASALCALAGSAAALAWVRTGPLGLPGSPPLHPGYVVRMFRDRRQRLVNLGYFGHMLELYAMWTWLPAFLAASFVAWAPGADVATAASLLSFVAIGLAGATGCVVAGLVADRVGRAEVTVAAMSTSGLCCLLAALLFGARPLLLGAVVCIWGFAVIADSAQFSAALSEVADPRYVGTALTTQLGIGFLLTLVTIEGLPHVVDAGGWRLAIALLGVGPAAGALAMARFGKLMRASD